MADETLGGDHQQYDWEGEPDVTDLSEEELRLRLKTLAGEERDVSYRRRVLQGRIDLIRAELVRRGGAALSPEELVRVLMGGGASGVSGLVDERTDETSRGDAAGEGPGGRRGS